MAPIAKTTQILKAIFLGATQGFNKSFLLPTVHNKTLEFCCKSYYHEKNQNISCYIIWMKRMLVCFHKKYTNSAILPWIFLLQLYLYFFIFLVLHHAAAVDAFSIFVLFYFYAIENVSCVRVSENFCLSRFILLALIA